MFWGVGGQFVVVGGGWCKPRVAPKIAKIRFRIIRVLRNNSVLYCMGHPRSPYDPSLIYIYLSLSLCLCLCVCVRTSFHSPLAHSNICPHYSFMCSSSLLSCPSLDLQFRYLPHFIP